MDISSADLFLSGLNTPVLMHGAKYGFLNGIKRTKQLLHCFEVSTKPGFVITVTGSKGKGSTCSAIASILVAAGYKVGLYTGPHLYQYRERIQINGEMISAEQYAHYVELVKHFIDSDEVDANSLANPTTFECITAIAVKHFMDSNVDFSVLEIGLGGRLDAVNSLDADVAVITNISLEHTETLGKTVDAIATEKIQIARPHTTVVSANQPPPAKKIITEYCASNEISLIEIGRDWLPTPLSSSVYSEPIGQFFQLERRPGIECAGNLKETFTSPKKLFFPLLGDHQVTNASLAIATVDCLSRKPLTVDLEIINRGLANIIWPGRLEIIQRDPLIVIDGAHNPESMQRLMASLKKIFQFNKLIVVAGIVSTKDIHGIIKEILPHTDELIVVEFAHRRSSRLEDLLAEVDLNDYTGSLFSFPTVVDGLTYAKSIALPNDLICVTGSLYLVAEARQITLLTKSIFPG